MRILITGASGFIGKALCKELSLTAEVWRLVRSPSVDPKTIFVTERLDTINFSSFAAVIHLAYPKGEVNALAEQFTAPVNEILSGIARTNPSCHLIFFSSQSATAGARSPYGVGKFETERLLENSPLSWTVIRPGLVVDPAIFEGLYGQICSAVRWLPIIPVPGGLELQPVLLNDIVAVAKRVLDTPSSYNRRAISVALPKRPLSIFAKQCALTIRRTRLVIPIPLSFIESLLALVPGKVGSLLRGKISGLQEGAPINPSEGEEVLGRPLLSFPLPTTAADECEALCKALFRRSSPPRLTERYVSRYPAPLPLAQSLLASPLGLLGYERKHRGAGKTGRELGDALSERFSFLAHLAEGEETLHKLFYAPSRSFFRGVSVLIGGAIFTVLAVMLETLRKENRETV